MADKLRELLAAQSQDQLRKQIYKSLGLKVPGEVAEPGEEGPRQEQKAEIPGLDAAARTVWGESRGNPEGMAHVSAVMVNRLKSGKYGNTLEEVVKKPKQFSVWNVGDPNRRKMLKLKPDDAALTKIRAILEGLVEGTVKDPTGGADHYHVTSMLPKWDFSKLKKLKAIGGHQFYRSRNSGR